MSREEQKTKTLFEDVYEKVREGYQEPSKFPLIHQCRFQFFPGVWDGYRAYVYKDTVRVLNEDGDFLGDVEL